MDRKTVLLTGCLIAAGGMGLFALAGDPPPPDALNEGTLHPYDFHGSSPSKERRTEITALLKLQAEKQRYETVYGPGHPKVRELEQEIELVKKHLEQSRKTTGEATGDAGEALNQFTPQNLSIDVHKLHHGELCDLIEKMLGRIDSLEKEVATLKQNPAQTELLDRPVRQ